MLMAHGFGKRMVGFLFCCTVMLMMAMPVSAVMTEMGLELEDRQVSTVHYGASYRSTVIGYLQNGVELTVTGEAEDFYEITCGGMTGYIAKEQVKVDDNGYCYVNCNTESEETTTLPCQDEVHVQQLQAEVVELAEEQLGVPYAWGGTSPSGFDCSGFVQYIYQQMGYSLNRGATGQLSNGMIVDLDDLQPGDVVFFRNTSGEDAITSHVGIYVGDGQFIHAASKGITYSSLEEGYYLDRFLCARRVILSRVIAYQSTTEINGETNRNSGLMTGVFHI